MPTSTLLKNLPKIAFIAGGISLAMGIPSLGFALLTGSAALNLVGAIRQNDSGDVRFFSVWTSLNSWFWTHNGGH